MWARVRQGSRGKDRGEVETGRPGMESDGFSSGPQDSVKDRQWHGGPRLGPFPPRLSPVGHGATISSPGNCHPGSEPVPMAGFMTIELFLL